MMMMTLLNPPYSIIRLAGIESDEKVEEKELKEGGGEDRVDSSESDEPKVELKEGLKNPSLSGRLSMKTKRIQVYRKRGYPPPPQWKPSL